MQSLYCNYRELTESQSTQTAQLPLTYIILGIGFFNCKAFLSLLDGKKQTDVHIQWDNYNIHLHKYTVKAAALVRIKLDSFGIEHTGRRVTCKTSGEYALVKETGYTINIWSFRIPLWDKHSSKNGKRVHFSSVVKKLPDTLINRWLTKCDYCLKLNSF